MTYTKLLVPLLFAASAFGQRLIRPNIPHGASLPATCSPGDLFFKTGVSGQNLYGCPTTNTWALEGDGGGGGGGITALTGDVTASGTGSVAATLSTVVSPSTCGDTTHSCGLTYDGKGRITGATNNVIAGGGGGGTFNQTIQNATTPLTQRIAVNFTGTGVVCIDNAGASRTDCTITAGSGGYGIIQNNGTAVTSRTTLNLINGGCVDNAGAARTDCTLSGSGGGSGFAVTRTSPTVLTIAPGNVSCGGLPSTFGTSLTLTVTGALSSARLAFDCAVSPPLIRVYADTTNASLVGTGAGSVVGSTIVPATSFEFYSWTAASTAWDTLGGNDERASLQGITISGDGLVNFSRNPSTGNYTGSLDTTLVTLNPTQNAQVGTSYTVVNADCGKWVTFSNASATAITLPQAGASGNFATGCNIRFANIGAGAVTITPATSTLDGQSSIILNQYQGLSLLSNGTNYLSIRGQQGNGTGISYAAGVFSLDTAYLNANYHNTATADDWTQIATPGSNPSSGKLRVYVKTGTNTLCTLNSSGTETCTGGGGGATYTYTAVSFSATPTFTYGTGATTFKITLTGAVTSSTAASAAAGQRGTWIICQDGTGSRAFAWPTGFKGAMTIGSTASTCNTQSFMFDGTNYYADSTGVINQ